MLPTRRAKTRPHCVETETERNEQSMKQSSEESPGRTQKEQRGFGGRRKEVSQRVEKR